MLYRPHSSQICQVENVSSALCSIYLNDLQTYLYINGTVGVELLDTEDLTLWRKLYTDDTILISNYATDLQKCLDSFNNYCYDWHLKVNISKTK